MSWFDEMLDKILNLSTSKTKIYVTKTEFLKGRDSEYPLSEELEKNMVDILFRINKLRHEYGKPFVISSGYRPGKYNKKAGGAKKSAHVTCQAIDIVDKDKELAKWCIRNVELLEKLGLYMENPDYTPTWVHLQTRPTKSRIFKPY
jgi:hypothetical protein